MKCPVCEGKGSYLMSRDAHRSGGIVPCRNCNKTGVVPDKPLDPVHAKIGIINDDNAGTPHKLVQWWFWDETWSNEHGPYNTELEARDALQHYVETI